MMIRWQNISLIILLLISNTFLIGQSASEIQQFTKIKKNPVSKSFQERFLKDYYSNRKILAGPPVIPHDTTDSFNLKMNRCLSCHREGSYTPNLGKHAPKTPHPEYTHCNQCHLPQADTKLFVENGAELYHYPKKGSALPMGPPRVPHDFQNKSNCRACHTGPSAVKELRTSHPERIHCRQCHVPSSIKPNESEVFKNDLK